MFPVSFGDMDGAAHHLIHLLTDKDARLAAGAEARSHALELSEYNYSDSWQSIFASLAHSHATSIDEAEALMWNILFDHWQQHSNTSCAYNAEHEIELIHASASYKIGQFITFPARKIRTFVRCLKEHGFRYTIRTYLQRGDHL